MEMVRRGVVMWEVPVGCVRGDDQRIELTPDLQVQEAIRGGYGFRLVALKPLQLRKGPGRIGNVQAYAMDHFAGLFGKLAGFQAASLIAPKNGGADDLVVPIDKDRCMRAGRE